MLLKITVTKVLVLITAMMLSSFNLVTAQDFEYGKKYYQSPLKPLGRGFSTRDFVMVNRRGHWEGLFHGQTLFYKGVDLDNSSLVFHANHYSFYRINRTNALMIINLKNAKSYPLKDELKCDPNKLMRENHKEMIFQCGDDTYNLNLSTFRAIKVTTKPAATQDKQKN